MIDRLVERRKKEKKRTIHRLVDRKKKEKKRT